MFQVYFVKREGHKQRSLILVNCAQLSLVVMVLGYSAMNFLYLYGAPFCFDTFGVSLTNVTKQWLYDRTCYSMHIICY